MKGGMYCRCFNVLDKDHTEGGCSCSTAYQTSSFPDMQSSIHFEALAARK